MIGGRFGSGEFRQKCLLFLAWCIVGHERKVYPVLKRVAKDARYNGGTYQRDGELWDGVVR